MNLNSYRNSISLKLSNILSGWSEYLKGNSKSSLYSYNVMEGTPLNAFNSIIGTNSLNLGFMQVSIRFLLSPN